MQSAKRIPHCDRAFFLTLECPYMDSSLFASKLLMAYMARLQMYVRPVELAYVDAGPRWLFGRQFPIAFTYFKYGDIAGFS